MPDLVNLRLASQANSDEAISASAGPSEWWMVLGVTTFAAALRLYGITTAGLWTDEAGSAWVAMKHSLVDIWRWVAAVENKPPLYYLLLHLWVSLGHDEGMLRLLSVLSGTLVVPIVYGVGRGLGGRDVAMLAALFLSISPFNVHYSQEARMYSLLSLAAGVSMFGQAWLLRSPESAAVPIGTVLRMWVAATFRRRIRHHTISQTAAAWAAYVLGAAAALWTHYPAVFLPVAATLVMMLCARQVGNKANLLRNWAVAQMAVVALCAPLIPLYIHQSTGPNLAPVPAVDPITVLGGLMPDLNLLGSWYLFLALAPVELEIAVIAVGLAIRAWRSDQSWLVFALGLWLIPVVGEVTVSWLWRPVFTARTLIWTTIPFYLIIASSLAQLRKWPAYRGSTLIAFLLILSTGLVANYWTQPEYEAWRPAAQYVARGARPGDVVLFNDSLVQLPFDYYFKRYRIAVIERGVPDDFGANLTMEPLMTSAHVPALRSLAKHHKRLWLVYSHSRYTDPLGLVPENLAQSARLVDHQVFASREYIAVFLYEGRP